MCPARHQIESTDASALNVSASKTIANGKRVLWIDLIVDARIDSETALPCAKYICDWIDNRERLRIKSDCVDNRAVVNLITSNVKKERGTFVNSTTCAAAIFLQEEWGLLRCVRVA